MVTSHQIKFPTFMYGTAWKKEATVQLVKNAISSGFFAIDTANQPKHYEEPLVGEALADLARQGIGRDKFFLQTKFTPVNGQDHRIPYDPSADLAKQVEQSFQSSLKNLHTDYVDSYLLHGPYSYPGLGDEDWEVWHAIEKIYKEGKAKFIGVSNVNPIQLQLLTEKAEIKPMIVQNRCYAIQGWDRSVREFCKSNGVIYEGFSLLTANVPVLHDPQVEAIAKRLELTTPQVVFLFASQIGMTPLTGTTNEQHMKEDLKALQYQLTSDELAAIDTIAEN